MIFLTVLLGILKAVLFVLAALLSVALILLLIVLFWDIKFFLISDITESVRLEARVTWILKIFRLKIDYDRNSGVQTDLRVLWFKLLPKPRKEDAWEENQTRGKTGAPEQAEQKQTEGHKKSKNVTSEKLEETSETADSVRSKSKKRDFKPSSYLDRIKEMKDKFFHIINYPDREIIIKKVIELLGRLKRIFRRCYLKIYGEFGFDDPAATGETLGAIWAVTEIMGIDSALKGNFESKTIDVKIESGGKMTLWSILWPLVIFTLSKPIWKKVRTILFGKDDE